MDVANIIFDLDGTLVESIGGIEYSVDRAFERRGYSRRASGLRALIGPPVRHILSEISGEERAQEWEGPEAAFRESEGRNKTVLMRGTEQALHETIFARVGGTA